MIQPVQKPVSRHYASCVVEGGLVAAAEKLEAAIFEELHNFTRIVERDEKEYNRNAHRTSKELALEKHKVWLEKNWSKYCTSFADPWEIDPAAIRPRLELVENQKQNDLFRIARLTWSLPYSRGYGRRLDYLLWDDHNRKLMGILGLQSAPISFPARDKTYNIPYEQKIELVNQTMDAYTLGALPPYNELLAGKLTVLAAASREVREDYRERYSGKATEMLGRVLPPSLVAITTLSAFGKSSLYNRVSKGHKNGQNVWATHSLGPCEGWGTFHFSDSLYQQMKTFYKLLWPDKHVTGFGTGPRIRMQVIKRVLQALKLPEKFARHNIMREVFIIPHISNLAEVLSGTQEEPVFNDETFAELSAYWKERYCTPRAALRCPIEGRQTLSTSLGLRDAH